MALSFELVLKALAGLACLGSVSAGSWILVDKNSPTALDEEALAGGSNWTLTSTPNTEPTLVAGSSQEIKIVISLSGGGKTWECAIRGITPENIESGATSKIKEQLDGLKSSIGANGTWNPTSDDKKNSAKKFFKSCIGGRTFGEWREAKWGGKSAKSTISLSIKKSESATEYKFDEVAFKSLYTVASASQ